MTKEWEDKTNHMLTVLHNAWVHCCDCGAKLHEEEGTKDRCTPCPPQYRKQCNNRGFR